MLKMLLFTHTHTHINTYNIAPATTEICHLKACLWRHLHSSCLCRLHATLFVCVPALHDFVCVPSFFFSFFLFAHSLFMLSPFALPCFIYLVNLFMLTNCATLMARICVCVCVSLLLLKLAI